MVLPFLRRITVSKVPPDRVTRLESPLTRSSWNAPPEITVLPPLAPMLTYPVSNDPPVIVSVLQASLSPKTNACAFSLCVARVPLSMVTSPPSAHSAGQLPVAWIFPPVPESLTVKDVLVLLRYSRPFSVQLFKSKV